MRESSGGQDETFSKSAVSALHGQEPHLYMTSSREYDSSDFQGSPSITALKGTYFA
jgi:hypothetical protein